MLFLELPSGYLTWPWKPWPIEIDGLPFLKMLDLSMANWQCHNQMVDSST